MDGGGRAGALVGKSSLMVFDDARNLATGTSIPQSIVLAISIGTDGNTIRPKGNCQQQHMIFELILSFEGRLEFSISPWPIATRFAPIPARTIFCDVGDPQEGIIT